MATAAEDPSAANQQHELPSQNQLYAVLMLSCGAWRVRRPHRAFTALVDDINQRPEVIARTRSVAGASTTNDRDDTSFLAHTAAQPRAPEATKVIQRAAEAGVRLDADGEGCEEEQEAAAATALVAANRDEARQTTAAERAEFLERSAADCAERSALVAAKLQGAGAHAADVPLAQRTSIDLGDAYYGNANLCVLLDLMAHLPLIDTVDWSRQRLFAVDGYKQGPPGNEVLERLFRWAGRQRNLTTVRLGGAENPVGTRCVHWMIEACERNPGLVKIEFDESGVDAFLLKKLHRALDANRNDAARRQDEALRPPFYRLTEQLREMDSVDRKTAADRRELHTLIREFQESFMDPLDDESGGGANGSGNGGSATASRIIDGLLDPPAAPGAAASAASAVGGSPLEQFLSGLVASSLRRSSAECVKASRGLRGDGGSVFIVDSGTIVAHIGGHDVPLVRGDYFGEVLESEMYVAGQVAIDVRGSVFQVPHEAMAPLMRVWEAKVRAHLPTLKHVAALQPLPSWALIRACHDARVVSHPKGTVVLSKGSGPAGLFVVLKGSYMVRGRAKLGRSQVVFGPGDIFGEEAAVSRLGVYTVDIKASNDAEEDECSVLLISARHVKRHFVPHLRSVLAVHAKGYSDAV
eukprot:CAMPEP_0174856252 /NCGR_PEP_ID=MMETSP1114-20130205/35420_1 /TAXON_ID=312471 /ORGANISM="Neobodo designis, Strain CCAP 1951/1" /LENGTH=638 /DNA_ID=CAMNT_0016091039 /DNA_START=54 /DNA_END=1970 /DNA_ORIENTATION=+